MDRRLFGRAGLGLVAAFAAATKASAADSKKHRVVFQVSSEDRHAQQLALGNARNYSAYYKARGEPVEIEIVAYGPGLNMLRGDISMMKGDLENVQQDLGTSLTVLACHNTREAVADSMGKKPEDIPLLPGVKETPSGVVRIAEAQEQGWAYIRP